jgi:hypothetical protein
VVILPIPSCPGYFATDEGLIIRDGHILASSSNGHGYRRIKVSLSGIATDKYVHRLVCEAFHGPSSPGEQARHLNGVRDDNRPGNLSWADRATNDADKDIHGTRVKGKHVATSVLSEKQVIEARRRAAAGERYDHIATSLGQHEATVADAISGRRWQHVPGALGAFYSRRRFTDDEVRAIRAAKGMEPEAKVAIRYGVARNTIWQIMNRRSYLHVPG